MFDYFSICILAFLFMGLLIGWSLSVKFIRLIKRQLLYMQYSNINNLVKKASESAYQKFFREIILKQTASGYKLNSEEIAALQRDYVNYIFTYLGPKIIDDLEYLHGSIDAFNAILVNDLMVRIENDETAILFRTQAADEGLLQE